MHDMDTITVVSPGYHCKFAMSDRAPDGLTTDQESMRHAETGRQGELSHEACPDQLSETLTASVRVPASTSQHVITPAPDQSQRVEEIRQF